MEAFIGVGSNIHPKRNITDALTRLSKHVEIAAVSTFYKTMPVLRKNQDDYLNGVWQINTTRPPKELKFDVLKTIEKELLRITEPDRYDARTIDLDLLLYGDFVINEESFNIPDPDIYKRSFVAFPLFELNPDLILPDTNTPLATVLDLLSKDNLKPETLFTESLRSLIKEM